MEGTYGRKYNKHLINFETSRSPAFDGDNSHMKPSLPIRWIQKKSEVIHNHKVIRN